MASAFAVIDGGIVMRATVKHRRQLLDVLRRSLSNASEPALKTRLIDAIATLAKDMPHDGRQTRRGEDEPDARDLVRRYPVESMRTVA